MTDVANPGGDLEAKEPAVPRDSPLHFLELPLEVRRDIYKMVFNRGGRSIVYHDGIETQVLRRDIDGDPFPPHHPFLLTCRQIYEEAREIYYHTVECHWAEPCFKRTYEKPGHFLLHPVMTSIMAENLTRFYGMPLICNGRDWLSIVQDFPMLEILGLDIGYSVELREMSGQAFPRIAGLKDGLTRVVVGDIHFSDPDHETQAQLLVSTRPRLKVFTITHFVRAHGEHELRTFKLILIDVLRKSITAELNTPYSCYKMRRSCEKSKRLGDARYIRTVVMWSEILIITHLI